MNTTENLETCLCGEKFQYIRWHVPTQGIMCRTCFNSTMERDRLYWATQAMFGFLPNFAEDWQEGWRPVVEKTSGDILWRSPLGSYARRRRDEDWGDTGAFLHLASLCDVDIDADKE